MRERPCPLLIVQVRRQTVATETIVRRRRFISPRVGVVLKREMATSRPSNLRSIDGAFKLAAVALAVGLIYSADAQAKCNCQCINGRMQSICSNSGDLLPANCPMTACPLTSPAIVPIQPPQPPPPGTSVCSQQDGRRFCR
jgi:hypothetical protein